MIGWKSKKLKRKIGYRLNLYPLFYFNIFIYYNSEDRKFIQMKGERNELRI